jgi:hypothetical protein
MNSWRAWPKAPPAPMMRIEIDMSCSVDRFINEVSKKMYELVQKVIYMGNILLRRKCHRNIRGRGLLSLQWSPNFLQLRIEIILRSR